MAAPFLEAARYRACAPRRACIRSAHLLMAAPCRACIRSAHLLMAALCRACIRSAHAKFSSLDLPEVYSCDIFSALKKGVLRMEAVNRREFLAMAAAIPPLMQSNSAVQPNRIGTTSMFVCMHEASSSRYDFKTAMEGYAKAGIRGVEPDLMKVREFAMKESPATARRLLDDLGLKAVSSSNQLGLMEPGDQRAANLEQLKWKAELAQVIGADRLVTPSAGTGNYKEDYYNTGVDNMRGAAEIRKPYGVNLLLGFGWDC